MQVQAYTLYPGVIVIAVATPRPEATPSHHFTAGKIHEDYCARVRAAMREHKHIGTTSLEYPAAKRLQNYFPTHGGKPLYALRSLVPAGSPRDVDADFNLEIMRIRFSFVLNLLPEAFLAEEVVAEGLERHMEFAVRQLFAALAIPDVFIPGDDKVRAGDRTEIDIVCEMGEASGRTLVNIPHPAA